MPREYQENVKGVFETPFGPIDFTLTQSDHVFMSAGSAYDQSPAMEINRVPYHVNLHLFLQPDGSWATKSYTDIHMTREGTFGDSGSSAARKKFSEGVAAAWTEFVPTLEVSLVEAELVHLNNQLLQVEEDLSKEMEKVAAIEAKRAELLGREREMLDAQAKFSRRGGYPKPQDWSPLGRRPQPRPES